MAVVSLGELLIDFVALEHGVSVGEASGFQKAPGGAPANVAVGVARLGHPVRFLGQVGDDPFGHFLADVMAAESVDIRGLRFSKTTPTPLAFVALAVDGERGFTFFGHTSAAEVTLDDATKAIIDDAKVLHFGGLTLIDDASQAATLAVAQYARERGLIVHYDPTLRLNLWHDDAKARERLNAALAYADIVKVSDEELAFMAAGGTQAELRHPANRLVIVTHGGSGATAYPAAGEPVHVPAFNVEAVDTTGAGDSFVAGMLAGVLEHPDDYMTNLAQLMRFAGAVGALTTQQRGAIPALPDREQVEAFLAAQAAAAGDAQPT